MNQKIKTLISESSFSDEAFAFLPKEIFFLNKKYISSIKSSLPENIKLFFVEYYFENQCLGIAMFQKISLYNGGTFPNKKNGVCTFKNFLSKLLKINILIFGNNMLTGKHGYYFDVNIHQNQKFKLLTQTLIDLSKKQKTSLIVMKDVFSEKDTKWLTPKTFTKFVVQPNMQMAIIWQNMEEYFVSLKKSYRQNLQRTRKYKEGIEVIELDFLALELHQDKIHELYVNVLQNASFNTFELPKNHFLKLKTEFKTEFKVFAYFKNKKMIAFYSLFLQNDNLDSYFLGYNPEFLKSNKLYLNMLLDMLEIGIKHKAKQLLMGRTAMEIKSNIGLEPVDYFGFIKHSNPIINLFIPKLFQFFNPKVEWEQRHPFK